MLVEDSIITQEVSHVGGVACVDARDAAPLRGGGEQQAQLRQAGSGAHRRHHRRHVLQRGLAGTWH